MTIGNVTSTSNNCYNTAVSKKDSSTQEFVIPQICEQQSESPNVGNNNNVDPLNAMEAMTGKTSAPKPSYTVTEEEAEYFRKKYGEEFDEENPYQLFYELASKNIISRDDAVRSSGIAHIITVCNGVRNDYYSDKHGWCNNYYDRFMGSYDKEINTWQDVAQKQYDFWQYMINLDERMVTPDGTYFQSSKEQMNVGFRRECESILKVKDVLSQIFD